MQLSTIHRGPTWSRLTWPIACLTSIFPLLGAVLIVQAPAHVQPPVVKLENESNAE
jgi:hypothetical protein